MTTLATYLNRGNADPICLVEFNALKLSDGSLTPLYFSKPAAYFADKQFIPAISALPDIDRAANDTMEPAYLPTYGDLTLMISGAYKPDAANSVAWNLLLYKDTYSLMGQDITIKIGQPGDAYSAFTTIFTGQIGEVSWTDSELNLTIYDKAQELETKYPDYELPESDQVDEDSWDQSVPIILGQVKNFTPVLIKSGMSGTYGNKYALACHVIDSLQAVYFNQNSADYASPSHYLFNQFDVSPVKKDTIGGGTVLISSYGPYTGSLSRASWKIEIDSVTAGTEVGQATLRWSLDDGATWEGTGILTWKLGYDSNTLVKSPTVGAAVMAVSGDYTGDVKLTYKTKITRGGDIGDVIPPQFIYSDDDGVTWKPDNSASWTPAAAAPGVSSVTAFNPGDSVLWEITTGGNVGGAVRFKWSSDGGATYTTGVSIPDTSPIELFPGFSIQFAAPGVPATDDYDIGDAGESSSAIDILNTDPIALNRGLSVAFSGTGADVPVTSWTPSGTPPAPGVMSWVAYNPADEVEVEIDTAGNVGGAATFKWTGDGWATSTTLVPIPSTSPIALFAGFSVQFTAPGEIGNDDYDLGDAGIFTWVYVPAFVVNDLWTFTFKEIPIPLADGVSIQFTTQTGQDFYLADEFSFILMSTLSVYVGGTSMDHTVDIKGLINPATSLFADTIGQMIYSLLRIFLEWDDADIDLVSIAAFDVAIPYAAGLAIDSPEDATSIITKLLTGIPAIFSITNAGKFYLQELIAPAGTPVLTMTDEQIMDLPNFNQSPDIVKRIYLEYDKNYTTHSGGVISGVTQARLAWLNRGNRQISRKDDSVLTNYPMASDIGPLETALIDRDDAGLLADKLLALHQIPHETMEVEIGLQAAQLDIGDVVEVSRETFGQDAGQLYKVLGTNINFTDRLSEVTLWR